MGNFVSELLRSYIVEAPVLLVATAALVLIVGRGLAGTKRTRFALAGFGLILITGLLLPLLRIVLVSMVVDGDTSRIITILMVFGGAGSLLHATGIGLLFAALNSKD